MPKIRAMEHVQLIKLLGGTTAVARLLGIKPPSVSGWNKSGVIPEDKLIRLAPVAESRGIATRKQLFPKDYHLIWPEIGQVCVQASNDPTGQQAA